MVQQPLNNRIAIVNSDGTPTQYFIRMLQERGIDLDDKVTLQQVIDQIGTYSVVAGTGLGGGGSLTTNPTLFLDASIDDLNDVDTSTTPPTNGQALVWDSMLNLWVPGTISGGGGGGSSVASARVDFTSAGAMTITNNNNIASIVRVAAGRYTVTFTSAIPAGCALWGVGRFGDAPTNEGLLVNLSRLTGEGLSTTVANITIHAAVVGGLFDPYESARPNSWIYFEVIDPASSGGGGGGIPEAPIDGMLYGRINANWQVVPEDTPGPFPLYAGVPPEVVYFDDGHILTGDFLYA